MKAASPKIISCLLLGITLLPLIFAIYVQISEVIIHDEMKKELEKNHLSTLQVQTNRLVWTETGKEAIINGHMFDVVKFSVNGSEVELTGLFDTDEDNLITQLDNQENNNPESANGIVVLKWLSCFSWIQYKELGELFVLQENSKPAYLQYQPVLTPVLSCDTPPPEAATA